MPFWTASCWRTSITVISPPAHSASAHRAGKCTFPQAGRLCQRADIGSEVTGKLGLQTQLHANDGDHTEAGALLLTATGRAEALHQGWKIVQNVIEWSSGVTQMTRCMVDTLRQYQPDAQLACTRKNIPVPSCWQPLLYWPGKALFTVRAARKLFCCLPITAVSGRAGKLVCSDCNIAP